MPSPGCSSPFWSATNSRCVEGALLHLDLGGGEKGKHSRLMLHPPFSPPPLHQDGSVRVPPALRPFVGQDVIERPPAPLLRYIGPNQPGGGGQGGPRVPSSMLVRP